MKARRIIFHALLFGTLGAVFGFFSATLLDRQARVPTASFVETQRGHLARLDGASAPGRVIFLGSSTFQGLDVSAVSPLGLNLGLGGDTLHGLAERSAHYRSPRLAQAVMLNIGLNDLMQQCRQPETTLDRILAQIPAQTPVFVLGLQRVDTHRHGMRCSGRITQLITDLNTQHAQACARHSNCSYLLHPAGPETPPSTSFVQFEDDGIHLSAAGYQELIERLRAALAGHAPELATSALLHR